MKSTIHSNFACLVFGHNLYKPKSHQNSSISICKTCKAEIDSDNCESFESNNYQDKTFENTLKRLFLLNRKIAG